jgi:Helix-turn-helix domain/Probable transposase
MRRAYVFRLRPTARQHVALAGCVESHRELYNAALAERRDAWSHSKTRICYGDQSGQLTKIRAIRPDVAQWSFSSQQATLRRLSKAFAGFFRRVKTAKPGVKPGYPRFKGAGRFDSVEWPKDGDGARWLPEVKRVYLQGIGRVKVELHRPVTGRLKTIQIKRSGRRWMLVLSCDDVPTNPLPTTGRQAGVDVGIVRYATLSDGTAVDNPRWNHAAAKRLALAQQRLARANRRSRNREKSGKPSQRGNVRVRTSVRTFTTNRPARSSGNMTCWWWRIYRSLTCCAGLNPCPIPTIRGSFYPMERGRRPGSTEVSATPAGASSSQYCAPKRKKLGAPGLRSTPATPRTAARNAGMLPPKTAPLKRNSNASDARIAPRRTNMPHATSYGRTGPSRPSRVKRSRRPPAVGEVTQWRHHDRSPSAPTFQACHVGAFRISAEA